jgi:NAD(P)-dependent dehydrogenase (short-subunit alcohol dehydrogenase family)
MENGMARLKGKVVFITGCGGGIGRAAAARFVEEGAQVAAADINEDSARSAASAANEYRGVAGGNAFAVQCDIVKKSSVEAAIAETITRYGKLNVLYNNAGGSTMRDGPVTEAPEEEFWRSINLDLFGTFLCSKVAIPEIIKAGGGSVINTTSLAAIKPATGRDCYTAAKGGVVAISRSMALEYGTHLIRVNAIAPSLTLTDRIKSFIESNDEAVKKWIACHMLGLIQPLDVANAAVFLASDESRTITGQVLAVCSGASLS